MAKDTLDAEFYRAALLAAARRHITEMSDEQRAALVEEALREELGEIDVSALTTPLLKQHVLEKTREILRLDEFDKRFDVAIRNGIERFLAALSKATAVAMVGMFTGVKEYDSGSIHQALRSMIEASDKRGKRGLPSDAEIPF